MSIPRFDEKELEVKGIYTTHGGNFGWPQAEVEILNYPVTPKENMRRFFRGEEYYWIPDITTDANLMLDDTTPDANVQNLEGGMDSFGVPWSALDDRSLPAFVRPGSPILDDICNWRDMNIPDPDGWDWKKMRETWEPFMHPDRINYGFMPGLYFERLIHILDSENALCALLEDPDEVEEFFERITDIHCRTMEHMRYDLDIDMIWLSDDWGTQIAPFFSRNVLTELFAPSYRRLMKKARELDIIPITHSCGKTACYMKDYIDMDIQIWEPQTAVNPDLYEIHRGLGEKLILEDYTLFAEEGGDDLEAYRGQMEYAAAEYLLSGRVFITSGIMDHFSEKRKILYEVLRKAASGELAESRPVRGKAS